MPLLPFFSILLVASLGAYLARSARAVGVWSLAVAVVFGGGLVVVSVRSLVGTPLVVDGWWQADLFTWLLAALVGTLYLTATAVSVRYIGEEYHEKILSLAQVRLYFLLLPLFILSMLVSVFADNVGILWMGLEGTTLATTLLVALYRKNASIEAAWKYVLLCSIGIGLGLFGLLLFTYAAVQAGLSPEEALSLRILREHATTMDPQAIRLAFALVLIGLGTKVGFVPMHTWLPDAHGKTPSPISALLSGVLLNVAFAALLRFKTITDVVNGSAVWSDRLFLAFGTISVVTAAFFLLQQRNYKRMLAYSSVEHMGLLAVMVGLGPLGAAAAVLHMIGHTLVKSLLFFASGEILLSYGTTKIEGVRGLLSRLPVTAGLFVTGLLLLLATPPSLLFMSEFQAVAAGMRVHPGLTVLVLAALTVISFSMLRHALMMLFGNAEESAKKERWNLAHTVMAGQAAVAIGLGVVALHPAFQEFVSRIAASFIAVL